jgi:Ca2+/H+ antiporter
VPKPSLDWLLVFIPVAVALEHGGRVSAPVVFFSAALAIIPIASLIVRATEQVASRTGDAVGGLLNATFGNAPELIIAVVALRAGLFDMVWRPSPDSSIRRSCSRASSPWGPRSARTPATGEPPSGFGQAGR